MSVGINDPLDAFYNLCVERGACPESLEYTAAALNRGWTVREYIDNAKLEHAADYASWALWCRTELGDAITFAVRLAFSDEATRDDPRIAAHLDIYVATSKTEGELLASRWNAEEFPNIARQLGEGIVERKRD